MRHLCRSPLMRRIAAFLVLDGAATDHITTQALGSRRFEVTFTGPGGHSWSDFGIGNPVHALSRAIALFVDRRPVDPRSTPKVSVNVGIIEGGASINAIPRQRPRQSRYPFGERRKDRRTGRRSAHRRRARGGNRKLARHRRQGRRQNPRDRQPPGRRASPATRHRCATSAPWMPISEFAPGWTAPPPTPTFRCPWAFRPSPSAQAARAAARIPLPEWYRPKAATWV